MNTNDFNTQNYKSEVGQETQWYDIEGSSAN